MTKDEIAETKRLALAHRMLEVTNSPMWRDVVVPYLEGEQKVLIANMAGQVEALQLMRFAGSVQTFHSLINLESTCKNVVEQALEKKMSQIKN